MSNNIAAQILGRVLNAYRAQIEKETFNGIKLQETNEGVEDDTLKDAVIRLVRDRKIDVISSNTQLNPHIKRLPPVSIEKQLENLEITEKYHTCLYPTPATIEDNFDLTSLNDKPFTGLHPVSQTPS